MFIASARNSLKGSGKDCTIFLDSSSVVGHLPIASLNDVASNTAVKIEAPNIPSPTTNAPRPAGPAATTATPPSFDNEPPSNAAKPPLAPTYLIKSLRASYSFGIAVMPVAVAVRPKRTRFVLTLNVSSAASFCKFL